MSHKSPSTKKKITLKQLLDYSIELKSLAVAHNIIWPGKHPHIPSLFSENLIKLLFNLKNSIKSDAECTINDKKYYFEIKATGSPSGATTISKKAIEKKEFNFLIWANFDLIEQIMEVKILKRSKIPKSDDPNNRQNIRLGKKKLDTTSLGKLYLLSPHLESQVKKMRANFGLNIK
jgi:hypothetical protein